ncbi:MAG: DUF3313 domain-containing protein [Candidatus Brocadiaceae bacterium]|nr:DUF3313 domain-containing protein [Candidatus Brocadiaceae bacterium]
MYWIQKSAFVYWFLRVLFLLSVSACATQKPMPSGFLGDYSSLKPSSRTKGAYVYFHPDREIKNYTLFIVDPVMIHLRPEADNRIVHQEEINALAKYFQHEIITALEGQYTVVEAPGNGVLVIKTAITDVAPDLLYITPSPETITSAQGLGGASMEAALIDSLSGEIVAAVMDSRIDPQNKLSVTHTRWGNTKEVLSQWAQLLRLRMDEFHRK